jgi:glucose-6-phosphate 1-dehydrogenase
MIERLAIFGATGDLTGRYLLPGLVALRAARHLDDRFQLLCAGREDWDSETFRRWATEQLDRHAGDAPPAARQAVVTAARYRRVDLADPASVAAVIAGDRPVAAYLALPPVVFPTAVRGDEAEESWRIVEPVLAAWSKDLVPLQEYPAGSHGPRPKERVS